MFNNLLVNPFVSKLLAMALRYGVVTLAGVLGLSGALDPYMGQLGQITTQVAVAIITVVVASKTKHTEQQKLNTATEIAGVTEKIVEAMVKDPNQPTPSVATPKTEVPVSPAVP